MPPKNKILGNLDIYALNSARPRQSVWHFEKSSVLSATKSLFRQNIAQPGESPQLDNFGLKFGQEGIHPEWTRWPKCVSQLQLGSVVVPLARVIRDRCGSFGKVNAHVKCRLCLLLLFLNGPLSGGGDFKDPVHYHRCLCHKHTSWFMIFWIFIKMYNWKLNEGAMRKCSWGVQSV